MATVKPSKVEESVLNDTGMAFVTEIPKVKHSRSTHLDEVWAKAKELCQKHPGEHLRVRVYDNTTSPSVDAKKINNLEHRVFSEALGDVKDTWLCVVGPSNNVDDIVEIKGIQKRKLATYLKYTAPSQ